jgi:hypothetical protein
MKELDAYMGDLYNEINGTSAVLNEHEQIAELCQIDHTIEVLGSMIQFLSPKIHLVLEASILFAELDW